ERFQNCLLPQSPIPVRCSMHSLLEWIASRPCSADPNRSPTDRRSHPPAGRPDRHSARSLLFRKSNRRHAQSVEVRAVGKTRRIPPLLASHLVPWSLLVSCSRLEILILVGQYEFADPRVVTFAWPHQSGTGFQKT